MSTWPNMPVGATVLLDYDFNTTTLASAGILDVYGSTIAGSDGTAPVSPSSTVISRIPASSPSGGSQMNWSTAVTYPDIFVALSWRTNASWVGNATVANKMFFVRGPGANGFFGLAGAVNGPFTLGFAHNTGGIDNSHIWPGDLGLSYAPNNISSGVVAVNTWTRIECYFRKSTTSTSRDGIVRWWINGTLCANYTNINYAQNGFNEWVWTETWDGSNLPPPLPSVTREHHLDHLFIATTGASGGGSTPTLSTFSPSTVTMTPGNVQTMTVGMSTAVTSNTSVSLSSSNTAVATVPLSVTVSSGNSSASFPLTAVGAGSSTITASLGSVARTSSVTVTLGGSSTLPTTYTYTTQFSGVQGQNQWSYRDTGGNLLVYDSSGIWRGNELYLAIWDSGFSHSWSGTIKGAVLRWTAPAAGSIAITGTALLYEAVAGATFTVKYNSTTLFAQAMSVSTSYPYVITGQAVASGDTIDFILTRDTIGANNNTQLNPVIVFTPTTTGSGSVTVSSMTPSHGNIGSSVTIVGTGFSATAVNNTITVNGVPAPVTSANTTQLVFTVPVGATTGLVNITTSAGSGTAGTYTVDDPVTPDTPPASNFGGSATLLLVMP